MKSRRLGEPFAVQLHPRARAHAVRESTRGVDVLKALAVGGSTRGVDVLKALAQTCVEIASINRRSLGRVSIAHGFGQRDPELRRRL